MADLWCHLLIKDAQGVDSLTAFGEFVVWQSCRKTLLLPD